MDGHDLELPCENCGKVFFVGKLKGCRRLAINFHHECAAESQIVNLGTAIETNLIKTEKGCFSPQLIW